MGVPKGKSGKRKSRKSAMVEEEDDGEPLTSHEARAKESAAHAKLDSQMTAKEKSIK